MAIIELKVPSPGESITEVTISHWLVKSGDVVEKDQELAEIESDKATLTINAEQAGKVEVIGKDGDVVKVGDVIVKIDTSFTPEPKSKTESKTESPKDKSSKEQNSDSKKSKEQNSKAAPVKQPANSQPIAENTKATPVAKNIITEHHIEPKNIHGSGPNGRIMKGDVLSVLANGFDKEAVSGGWGGTRNERSEKMTPLRKKLAQRLVAVKQQTAMLTTFNEVDMSAIMTLRSKYKDQFKEKYGVGVGFMSFFTKAVCEALHHFPVVNASIDGDNIIYHDYCDIGIAVSAPKGLMVPVIRNAEVMSLADIENEIKRLALKARDSKLTIDEMTGGTFTITNGGVFGSLMSTPILNPPQSAILGMHNVVDRPIAVNGQVVIRPMMYVALSYDHRIIDGKESVSFLVKVKEMLENPVKILFGGKSAEEIILGL
ncbi:MAG TPA: 2-oxoglutarate dehydrogenase complex dihydrolipoyllysine-residue succinyltransferase [Bacteroidia bacterium]|nr:2-oxoglutarate dehydrogenase complex dihydrolipoyllysine-residue succinyltransferase [Bacteroidia bacterium]